MCLTISPFAPTTCTRRFPRFSEGNRKKGAAVSVTIGQDLQARKCWKGQEVRHCECTRICTGGASLGEAESITLDTDHLLLRW